MVLLILYGCACVSPSLVHRDLSSANAPILVADAGGGGGWLAGVIRLRRGERGVDGCGCAGRGAGLGDPARSGRPLRLELELKFGCLGGLSAVAAVRARRRRCRLSACCRRRGRLSAPRLDDGASGGRATASARDDTLAARGGRGLAAATGLGLGLGGSGLQVREEGVWGREDACVGNELGDAAAGVTGGAGSGHRFARV